MKRHHDASQQFEEPRKVQRLHFPDETKVISMTMRESQMGDAGYCGQEQLHQQYSQLSSDVLNIFDTSHFSTCGKVVSRPTGSGDYCLQSYHLPELKSPTGLTHTAAAPDNGNSLAVSDGYCGNTVESQDKYRHLPLDGISTVNHHFPINSFPLSRMNDRSCPECAAGKSGHIRHIGRWRLMDSS